MLETDNEQIIAVFNVVLLTDLQRFCDSPMEIVKQNCQAAC